MNLARSFLEASARERVIHFLDEGSFREFCGPQSRLVSPHLATLGLPQSFDDGVVIGRGRLNDREVLVAAQEGAFNGGAVGEVHGAKIVGLLEAARKRNPAAVILMVDSGGVRLHEANAGIIAISEISRALLELRAAGIPVLAIVAGRCGAFGGMGIVTRLCHAVMMSEEGRLSLSGPEVIETVRGKEEFDSRDRALVWRITGGKIRRVLGEADRLVEDDIEAFREAASLWLETYSPEPLSLDALKERTLRFYERDHHYAGCQDGAEIFAKSMALSQDESLLSPEAFQEAIRPLPRTGQPCPDWRTGLMPLGQEDAEFFSALFPEGAEGLQSDGYFLAGQANLQGQAMGILGTRDRAPIGYALALRLSAALLSIIEDDLHTAPRPLLLMADTEGQLLSRRDELMGLNGALAHLALCVDLARRRGHALVTLIRHEAVSGGFLSFGMLGDTVCATADAEVRVMDLRAMARVTKIPLERLEMLAQSSPVFAPGAANYEQMGAVDVVWGAPGTWPDALALALKQVKGMDRRAESGLDRGGRLLARPTQDHVLAEALL